MDIRLFLIILQLTMAAGRKSLKLSWGAPVGDFSGSLSVGPGGPLLLHDTVLVEELARFSRERIPERVVHAKGSGAFGYFEVTDDITKYTKAILFSKIGKRTPILIRFSLGASDKGGPETVGDTRGFAIKFYTEEGNWDLVGCSFPVFFFRDPILVPSFSHTFKRHPVTNLLDRNAFWDFISLTPESMHAIMFLYSDHAFPDGYRHMNGFGANTFKLVNENGEAVYCRFEFRNDQGVKNLTLEQAAEIQKVDLDYSTRDLYDAIRAGNCPSWTFYVQLMTFEQAETWYFNPFDVTKIWPEEEFPLIRVGKLVLNRLPQNFFAEIEQAAFGPGNLIPGIETSPDQILQGRIFAYSDTHRHRLGANFNQLPVNYPFKSSPRNYQRDGPQTVTDNQDGEVNYFPNSYGGPLADPRYKESCYKVSGDVCRWNSSDDDNFTQPGIHYREIMSGGEKERFINNIVHDLAKAKDFIQERQVNIFYQVDEEFGFRVRNGLRQFKEQKQSQMNKR